MGATETFTGDNMRLSVTYRSLSGASVRPGISFGNESDGSKYVFSMNTSGDVRLSRWNGQTSSWTNLLSNFTTRYANTGLGAANMLSVELEGTTVRLFVNGNLVSRRTLPAAPARNFTASLQGGSAVFQRMDVRPVVAAGSGHVADRILIVERHDAIYPERHSIHHGGCVAVEVEYFCALTAVPEIKQRMLDAGVPVVEAGPRRTFDPYGRITAVTLPQVGESSSTSPG